ncbi:unnamed protein product, partial [Phyllotreta striolata]
LCKLIRRNNKNKILCGIRYWHGNLFVNRHRYLLPVINLNRHVNVLLNVTHLDGNWNFLNNRNWNVLVNFNRHLYRYVNWIRTVHFNINGSWHLNRHSPLHRIRSWTSYRNTNFIYHLNVLPDFSAKVDYGAQRNFRPNVIVRTGIDGMSVYRRTIR